MFLLKTGVLENRALVFKSKNRLTPVFAYRSLVGQGNHLRVRARARTCARDARARVTRARV